MQILSQKAMWRAYYKGEDVGHPFRGNQYTGGESGGDGVGRAGATSDSEKELDTYLTQLNTMVGSRTPEEFAYKSPYDMVIKDGQYFTPQERPAEIPKQRDKECYANAGRLAFDHPEYTYVEGYAVPGGIPIPMAHAWCVDKAGKVIDNTWRTPGTAYRGIPFNTEFLRKTILQNKTWGLIPDMPRKKYDPMKNGFPEGAIARGGNTEKHIGILTLLKGGEGSGSWNGPGDPRFAREEGEGETVYHGTTRDAPDWNQPGTPIYRLVDKILKEGITVQSHMANPLEGRVPSKVYVTKHDYVATEFAWMAARNALAQLPEKSVSQVPLAIFHVKIPKGVQLEKDKDSDSSIGAFQIDKIPPDWIVGYETLTYHRAHDEIGDREYHKVKGVSEDIYYVPVVLGVIEEKGKKMKRIGILSILKGGEGSGNFGHAGRPGEVGGSAAEGGGEGKEGKSDSYPKYTGSARVGMGDTSVPVATLYGGSAEKHLTAEGKFTPERQALHDKIVHDHIKSIPVAEGRPIYYIMGGGTASGKSTMLDKIGVSKETTVFIDSDKLKPMLTDTKDSKWAAFSHEESSYLAKRIAQAAFETNRNALLDGTGDGSEISLMGKINAAAVNGYDVHGIYATNSIETAMKWEQQRAEQTGRKVPSEVLIEKHQSVSRLLPKMFGQFTSLKLYDTEGGTRGTGGAKLIMESTKSGTTIHDKEAYQRFLDKANYKMKSIESISDERKEKLLIAIGMGKSPKETAKNNDELEYCNIMAAAKKRTEDEGYVFDIPFEVPDVDKVK